MQPDPERFTLSGTVITAAGAPIAAADLLLGLSPATTSADGFYSFGNLLPGTYLLCLQDSLGNYRSNQVVVGSQDLMLNLTLPAGGTEFRATSVAPRLNSSAAPLNGPFTIEFSDVLDPASISDSSFSITPALGEFSLSVEDSLIEIAPRRQLPVNQLYVIESSGGITSLAGAALTSAVRWRFRTVQTDDVAPLLNATTPSDGRTNHPPNLGLVFEFNEPLAQPDAQLTVDVTPETSLGVSIGGLALFIQPDQQWSKNTEYTVSISGVADSAGNRDATAIHSITFTTGSTPAPSHNVDPEWNQVLNRIVFASNRFGNYDIYSVAPNGTSLIRLTSLAGDELHPTVSADGTLLAFQHRTAGGKWNIMVQNLDAPGEPREITTGQFNDTEPVFSRTLSNEIFFVSDRSDPIGIYLMNSDGSSPAELDASFGSEQRHPAPHPLLNTQLLFSAYRSGSQDVWRKSISAVDLNVVNLNLTSDALAEEHSPAWSPDASYIVYISDEDGIDNLWVADAGGDFPRQVTGFTSPVSDPSVSPSLGEELCVVSRSNPGGGSDLVIVDLVSGDIVAVPTQLEAED